MPAFTMFITNSEPHNFTGGRNHKKS
jgi:hypothetical protein